MAAVIKTDHLGNCDEGAGNDCARGHGIVAPEHVDDELDLKVWHEAKAEFDADPVSYSAEEMANKYL